MVQDDIPEALSLTSPPIKFSDTKHMDLYISWYNHFYNVVPVQPQFAVFNTRLNKLATSVCTALVV